MPTSECHIPGRFNSNRLLLQGLEAGARGFLLKDVSLHSLVNTIGKVYQGDTLVHLAITERILKGLCGLAVDIEESEAIHRSEGAVKNQVSSILENSPLGIVLKQSHKLSTLDYGNVVSRPRHYLQEK